MERIDDLSFSNIVNIIQGEDVIGADLINDFAVELEDVLKQLKALQEKAARFKSRAQGLQNAAKLVAQHLEKPLPLAVKRLDYIVVLSDADLTIERNVI